MIYNYRNIIDYFTMLARQHVKLNSSYHGDYEQILGATNTNIEYPCLWIESPEAKAMGDTDTLSLSWACAIVVLYQAPNDDFDQKQANLDLALDIVKDIIGRMRNDVIEGNLLGVSFNNSMIDQVYDSELSDSGQGYRFSFIIKTSNSELCYNPAKWVI